MEFLEQIVYWHWLVAGLILIGLEMLDGSGHLIWLGISALFVGVVHKFFPEMSWLTQIILFALASIISIYAWKTHKKNNPEVDQFPTLNKRGSNYIGRTFTLSDPIVDGVGKVNVDDTIWIVYGPDLEMGAKIKVTGLNGTAFEVVAA